MRRFHRVLAWIALVSTAVLLQPGTCTFLSQQALTDFAYSFIRQVLAAYLL